MQTLNFEYMLRYNYENLATLFGHCAPVGSVDNNSQKSTVSFGSMQKGLREETKCALLRSLFSKEHSVMIWRPLPALPVHQDILRCFGNGSTSCFGKETLLFTDFNFLMSEPNLII